MPKRQKLRKDASRSGANQPRKKRPLRFVKKPDFFASPTAYSASSDEDKGEDTDTDESKDTWHFPNGEKKERRSNYRGSPRNQRNDDGDNDDDDDDDDGRPSRNQRNGDGDSDEGSDESEAEKHMVRKAANQDDSGSGSGSGKKPKANPTALKSSSNDDDDGDGDDDDDEDVDFGAPPALQFNKYRTEGSVLKPIRDQLIEDGLKDFLMENAGGARDEKTAVTALTHVSDFIAFSYCQLNNGQKIDGHDREALYSFVECLGTDEYNVVNDYIRYLSGTLLRNPQTTS